MKKRILIFPCGSEIGLEIHRSMQHSTHFALIGASSVDDHGRFVYEDYIGGIPMHTDTGFTTALKEIIRTRQIDAIYPTMDAVAETLHNLAAELGIIVIGSSKETTAICADKRKTYAALHGHIPLARCYKSLDEVEQYPVFLKPAVGYGARGAAKANNRRHAELLLETAEGKSVLIQECLTGTEWTIDCFSDRHGKLRFHGVRSRNRVSNGISVNTTECEQHAQEFAQWADTINSILKPRGAWFFQAKQAADGKPRLLEVAARLAGSSALFRIKGVNFALLSCFDAFEQDVEILLNDFKVELDRALCNRFKTDLEYTDIFVDLDDTLIVNGKVNHELVAFLYQAINNGKRISLITRHTGDLLATLDKYRLTQLFDRVFHITDGSSKANYIDVEKAIFIDDSFIERQSVSKIKTIHSVQENIF